MALKKSIKLARFIVNLLLKVVKSCKFQQNLTHLLSAKF